MEYTLSDENAAIRNAEEQYDKTQKIILKINDLEPTISDNSKYAIISNDGKHSHYFYINDDLNKCLESFANIKDSIESTYWKVSLYKIETSLISDKLVNDSYQQYYLNAENGLEKTIYEKGKLILDHNGLKNKISEIADLVNSNEINNKELNNLKQQTNELVTKTKDFEIVKVDGSFQVCWIGTIDNVGSKENPVVYNNIYDVNLEQFQIDFEKYFNEKNNFKENLDISKPNYEANFNQNNNSKISNKMENNTEILNNKIGVGYFAEKGFDISIYPKSIDFEKPFHNAYLMPNNEIILNKSSQIDLNAFFAFKIKPFDLNENKSTSLNINFKPAYSDERDLIVKCDNKIVGYGHSEKMLKAFNFDINEFKNLFLNIRDNKLEETNAYKRVDDFNYSLSDVPSNQKEGIKLKPDEAAKLLYRSDIVEYLNKKWESFENKNDVLSNYINNDVLDRIPTAHKTAYYQSPEVFNLFFAIMDNDKVFVDVLLKNNPNLAFENCPKELVDTICSEMRFTPLEWAAKLNNAEIFESLYEKGARFKEQHFISDLEATSINPIFKIDKNLRLTDPISVAILSDSDKILKIIAEKHSFLLTANHVQLVADKMIGEQNNTAYNILNQAFKNKGLVTDKRPLESNKSINVQPKEQSKEQSNKQSLKM